MTIEMPPSTTNNDEWREYLGDDYSSQYEILMREQKFEEARHLISTHYAVWGSYADLRLASIAGYLGVGGAIAVAAIGAIATAEQAIAGKYTESAGATTCIVLGAAFYALGRKLTKSFSRERKKLDSLINQFHEERVRKASNRTS